MIYFVVYEGDLTKDPLNQGVEMFEYEIEAHGFARRMRDKGLTVRIYAGKMCSY